MKKLCLLMIFLFSTQNYSQTNISIGKKDKLVYLDSTLNETTQDNYSYYRIIKNYLEEKDLYKINDFYKSGATKMAGTSITRDGFLKEGEFTFYYESGSKKAVINYVKSIPHKKCSEWYENGNQKLEGEYVKNEKTFLGELKIYQFWDSNFSHKVVDGNGVYEEIRENFFASGKVKDGFKDGLWEGYDKKLGITFVENYNNRKLILGVSTDLNKVEHNYTEIERRPEPQKGIQHLGGYFARNFIVPNVQGLEGKMYVKFVIEKDGSVTDIKVLKDVGYGSAMKVMKVASTYKGWIPGEQRGVNVRSIFVFPITIKSNN